MKKTRVVLDTNVVFSSLSSQVSAWNVRDDVDKRAKRADMGGFMRVMKKVKARPPISGDEI